MGKGQIETKLRMLCSRKEMCCSQVRKKLEQAVLTGQMTATEREQVLSDLVQDKFINDERFAGAFVRDKYKLAGWGRRKIEFQLKRYQISNDVISKVISENYPADDFQIETLVRLVEKKMDSLNREKDEQKKREKVIRFALGRGFTMEEIIKVMKYSLPL